jgi:hypothetical protein
MSDAQLSLQFERPQEHYYGTVPAGWELEVCAEENGPHTCFEEPSHEGPHKCGHHHDSTNPILPCNFIWKERWQ